MADSSWARWTPRFSLRTSLVLFLVLGTSLGLAARFQQETWERCEAQKWLVSRSALRNSKQRDIMFVSYVREGKRSWFVALIRKWVHPEYDRHIESISISREGISEEGAVKISRAYGVKTILLYGPATESSLAKILTTPGLENLYLDSVVRDKASKEHWSFARKKSGLQRLYIYPECYLNESTARELSQLPSLTSVTFQNRNLATARILATSQHLREFNYYGSRDVRHVPLCPDNIDSAWNSEFRQVLDELAKHDRLKRLRLFACDFRDPTTLKNLSRSSRLKILHLEKSRISSECLTEFARLSQIETLHLDESPLSPAHFQILAKMNGLYGLHGVDRRLKQEIEQLEASLPHCTVNPP